MSDETPGITASVAIQMGPMVGIGTALPYEGDLTVYAEQLTAYLATNIEKFADPRGADVFVAVSCKRGDEQAGHEYRSGHYVKAPVGTTEGDTE